MSELDMSGQNKIQRLTKRGLDDEQTRRLWEYAILDNRKNPAIYRTELELADKLVDDINAAFRASESAKKERKDKEVLAHMHINLNE